MSASFEEFAFPSRLRRPLAAVWISVGLHAALIALVQVAPPGEGTGAWVIEARLVPGHPAGPSAPVSETSALSPMPDAEGPLPAEPPAPPEEQAQSDPAPAASPREAPPAAAAAPPPPGPALASAVDLTYYSARELDVQPRALREIDFAYPEAADRGRISGTVRLQVQVEADGRVSDVSVASATPPDLFEASAVQGLRDTRFAPGQRNGRPVRARLLIEVEYDWDGRPR